MSHTHILGVLKGSVNTVKKMATPAVSTPAKTYVPILKLNSGKLKLASCHVSNVT